MKKTLVIMGTHYKGLRFDWSRTDCDIWMFNEAPNVKIDGKLMYPRTDALFQLHHEAIWKNPKNRSDEKHYQWLSGARVLVNHKTWYAHMFRAQGGDFGFPYPISSKDQDKARHFAKDLFFDNKWGKQIYLFSWLVGKFWPVKGWAEEDLSQKGIIYLYRHTRS